MAPSFSLENYSSHLKERRTSTNRFCQSACMSGKVHAVHFHWILPIKKEWSHGNDPCCIFFSFQEWKYPFLCLAHKHTHPKKTPKDSPHRCVKCTNRFITRHCTNRNKTVYLARNILLQPHHYNKNAKKREVGFLTLKACFSPPLSAMFSPCVSLPSIGRPICSRV